MIDVGLLWAVMIAIVVAYGLRAILDTRYMFAPPLILGIVLCYIYIKTYFDFDDLSRAALMDLDHYVATLAFTVLSLSAFTVLFELAARSSNPSVKFDQFAYGISTRTLGIYIAIIGAVGLAAQYAVASYSGGLIAYYSQAHGQAGKFDELSAYLYTLPHFLWAALIIGVSTLLHRGFAAPLLFAATIVIGLAVTANTLLFGTREGIIRICLTLGLPYVFVARPTPLKALPVMALMLLAVGAVSVVGHLRESLHLGSDTSVAAALAEQLARADHPRFGMDETGNELVFNVAVMQAIATSGTYSFGLPYIFPFLNFVPRAWWPSKPGAADFGVNPFDLVHAALGWRPAMGGAINCITESFVAFSWAGCIVTGAFGFICGRVFARAHREPTAVNVGYLITALIASVFWASQAFPAVFFQSIYTIVALLGLSVIGRRTRPTTTAARLLSIAPERRGD